MGIRWTHNFGNFGGLIRDLESDVAPRVAKQWGTRWMAMTRKRFDAYSKGGGDWKPLAPATIARRRFSRGGTIGGARKRALSRVRSARSARSATQAVRTLKRVDAAGKSVAILRDTGTLFRATTIGAPGNLFQDIRHGVRAGFAGARVHRSGKATLAQIAAFHNRGGGRLPKRQILVPPDAATSNAMKDDLTRNLAAVMRKHGVGAGRGPKR